MGYKKVCFSCRKAFNIYKNESKEINLTCPECNGTTTLFNHKFRPPKQSNIKKWKIAEYLKENGFVYQHIFNQIEEGIFQQMNYPETMEEAKGFVIKYKSQAYTDQNKNVNP